MSKLGRWCILLLSKRQLQFNIVGSIRLTQMVHVVWAAVWEFGVCGLLSIWRYFQRFFLWNSCIVPTTSMPPSAMPSNSLTNPSKLQHFVSPSQSTHHLDIFYPLIHNFVATVKYHNGASLKLFVPKLRDYYGLVGTDHFTVWGLPKKDNIIYDIYDQLLFRSNFFLN